MPDKGDTTLAIHFIREAFQHQSKTKHFTYKVSGYMHGEGFKKIGSNFIVRTLA